ncbi:MAG: Ig-like domain-containing protein [Bacteroidota bacterium]|nr:Ig-like domain-containing protein [Bacteroidota bacterium]
MKHFLWFILLSFLPLLSFAQKNRISYNNQELFLNGANIAWVNFARDIGGGSTDFETFNKIFREIHDSGGNSMRLWVHTNGAITPQFSGKLVTGPGKNTISDLKKIVKLANDNEIGLILCLWSFDMLRTSYGTVITDRSKNILTNVDATITYLEKALIPMVDSLKDTPGIIAWEIFNEPEGMSQEFGWNFTRHVPMLNIQRFINLCAGTIHRTDPKAKVTNGAWAFTSATDVDGNKNYYTDKRLFAAGGDPDGTLDFYTVHYYDWAGSARSPFIHSCEHWKLDKPLVVAEFYPDCSSCKAHPYENLINTGYAGAMGWTWLGAKHDEIVDEVEYTFLNYTDAVDLKGTLGNTPYVKLETPVTGDVYDLSSFVNISAQALDTDGTIAKIEFYANGSKVGESSQVPYNCLWTPGKDGFYELNAVATDNSGLIRKTKNTVVRIGKAPEITVYPNPCIPSKLTKIQFNLKKTSDVNVNLYSQTGSLLRNLLNLKNMIPGVYNYPVNVDKLPTGLYIVEVNNGTNRYASKLVVL